MWMLFSELHTVCVSVCQCVCVCVCVNLTLNASGAEVIFNVREKGALSVWVCECVSVWMLCRDAWEEAGDSWRILGGFSWISFGDSEWGLGGECF